MKVILYNAISINGNITKGEDDTTWVSDSDWKEFYKQALDSKVIVMGSGTYYSFGDDFPVPGVFNVVMTKQSSLLSKRSTKQYLFTGLDPHGTVDFLTVQGYKQLLLIGGSKLNTSFLKAKLINEIWLSVHPILIGSGKNIFCELDIYGNLELIACNKIDDNLVQLRYKVLN